jgi:hypothetical protein
MGSSVEGFPRILDCLVVGGLPQLAEIIAGRSHHIRRIDKGASTDGVAHYLLCNLAHRDRPRSGYRLKKNVAIVDGT